MRSLLEMDRFWSRSLTDILLHRIKKNGGEAIAVQGDVTATDFPKKLIKATIECVRPQAFGAAQAYESKYTIPVEADAVPTSAFTVASIT